MSLVLSTVNANLRSTAYSATTSFDEAMGVPVASMYWRVRSYFGALFAVGSWMTAGSICHLTIWIGLMVAFVPPAPEIAIGVAGLM